MNQEELIKYKLWFYENEYWQYNEGYFDEIEQALHWAEYWEVNGVIEEWSFTKKRNKYLEKQCINVATFVFDELNKDIKWEYAKWNRKFPCPGYVFNYYQRFIDKDIKINNLVDVLFKDDKEGLVA